MIDSKVQLAESKAAAEAPYVDQAVWLYQNRDADTVKRTWESFQPAMVTTEHAITFSLTIATALLVLAWILATMITSGFKRLFSTKRSPAH